ncbi:MAG: PAS domain S-box protein [Candidatus Celaenobacter polaris]|nr:PAS domain S-box protein [Candidatus Celaenobacter polaris]
MKKIIVLIIFLIIFSAFSLAAHEKLDLKIGTYENPPKIFTDKNGEISGFWADITKYIAQQENWEIEWIHGSWNQCLQRLENNEIDIMVDVGLTPSRQERFAFSNETVHLSWTRIYKKRGSDIQTILDLEGKKIAGLNGSFDLDGPEGLKAVTKKFEIDCEIIEMENYLNIFQALENNEIDAGITDKDFGNINDINFNIEKTPIILQPAHMQFAFFKDSKITPYLVEKTDFQIKELKKDKNSIYYRSLDKYLGGKGKITILPLWIKIIIAIIFFLIIIIFIFNRILRHQVVKKTSQLRKSEEQFRLFAENVPGVVSIYQWYPDGHREHIYRGPGLKDIIGEELAKKIDIAPDEYFKLIPEEDFKALDEASLKALETNKQLDCEYRLKIDDSTIKWVRALFSMFAKENGVILWQGIIYDITERKQAEEALRESEEKFRAVSESAIDSIFIKDINSKYIHANPAMEKLFGIPASNLINKTDIDLFGEEAGKHALELDKQVLKGEVIEEFPTKPVDGAMHSFHTIKVPLKDPEGKITGLCGIVRDITEQKQAEKIQRALYDISNALNTTDKMRDFYSKIREYLGNVIDTSNFYVALYDEKTDMISLPFDVDEKDDYETFPAGKTITKYVIKTGEPLLATNDVVRKLIKKGLIETIGAPSEIWLGVPLKIENKVIGVIAVQSYDDPKLYTEKDIEILTFISEEIALAIKHKQAEEELKINRERLKVANSILRHDIANDVIVIKSALDIYRNEQDETMLDEIEKRVEKSLNTIKKQRDQEEFIDSHSDLDEYQIEKVAHDVIKNYPNIKFNVTGTGRAYADNAVYSVFENIINNAIKHSKTTKLDIDISSDEDYCEIRFTDYGIGIPDEIKYKIFDEGFQYGETGHTGIGLYIVKHTVEDYDGIVFVEDNKPNGAVFVIRLKKTIER